MTDIETAPASSGSFLRLGLLIILLFVVGSLVFTKDGRRYSLGALYHIGPKALRIWVVDQGRSGTDFDIDLMMMGAQDSVFVIRQKSILAMDRNGEKSGPGIPLLIHLIEAHKDYRTRGLAVHALGEVKEQYESVGAAILLAAKDENVNVVIAAGMSADSLKESLKPELYKAIKNEIEAQILINSSGVKTLRIRDRSR